MRSELSRWTPLVAGALSLAACLGGTDRNYVSADGGPTAGDDATMDAPVQMEAGMDAPAQGEAGMDAGATADADAMMAQETGPTEAGPPADTGPPDAPAEGGTPGQTFSCNGTTVTSCANCQNNPIECVYCANDGGHPGVCGPMNQYCSNSAPGGAMVCNCPGGVAQCPAPFQVCSFIVNANYCQTCGEMGSNMKACKGGGQCSDVTFTCN